MLLSSSCTAGTTAINRPCVYLGICNRPSCSIDRQEPALPFSLHHLLPKWHIHLFRVLSCACASLIGSHKTLGNTQSGSHPSCSHLADTIQEEHMICPRSHFFWYGLILNPVCFPLQHTDTPLFHLAQPKIVVLPLVLHST